MTELVKMLKKIEGKNIPLWKVDEEARTVYGWAMVCKENGEDYYDSDDQHIPEEVALEAFTGFMKTAKVHKAMHSGEAVGEVVFAFPMLTDIIKSLGIETGGKTGFVTAVYVEDDDVLQKFVTGEYKGFSIGGGAIWEDVE